MSSRRLTKYDYTARWLLFDTNVLLDAVDKRRPESAEARRVLRLCNGAGDMGFAAPTSINDIYYILSKANGEPWARKAVSYLLGLVVVIPMGAEECDLSLASDEPDFEDGLVRSCAELNDIDFILTRDKAAFATSSVRSLTCAEYLKSVARA